MKIVKNVDMINGDKFLCHLISCQGGCHLFLINLFIYLFLFLFLFFK